MWIRKASQIIVSGVLLITLLPALGVNVRGIDTARVPVANTSVHAMQRALPAALTQVLVKVSGNPAVATVPEISGALNAAQGMLQSYNYAYRTVPGGQRQLLLKAVFDMDAVRALLRNANQGVWPSNRPLVLAWFKVSGGQYIDQILAANSPGVMETAVREAASHRGMPIIFPAMDLSDQALINTSTNLTFDDNKLASAASRYHVSVVLAARLNQTDAGWQSDWMLMIDGTPFSWRTGGDTPSAVLTQGINAAANLMANRWAVNDNSSLTSTVRLEVMGVSNIADYAKAMKTLRALAPVNSVEIQEVTGGNVILAVQTAGGEQVLANAIESQKQFITIGLPLTQGNQRADLYYRWKEASVP